MRSSRPNSSFAGLVPVVAWGLLNKPTGKSAAPSSHHVPWNAQSADAEDDQILPLHLTIGLGPFWRGPGVLNAPECLLGAHHIEMPLMSQQQGPTAQPL